jgi:ABC-type polysaccharide/polyol phosphate export permease
MFGVQSLVFKKFLKIEIPDYFLFLLGGLLPWIFFTTTVQMGTPTFVVQSDLLRSFKINPWIVLSSQVLDGFVNFVMSFLLIMIPFYLISENHPIYLLLLPFALLPLLIGTLSITTTLSVLNVFHRDINFVMGFVFSVLFFLTPIFYPEEFVPQELRWMIDLNPILYFIEPFRLLVHRPNVTDFFKVMIQGLGVSMIFASIAVIIWKRKRNEFYRVL